MSRRHGSPASSTFSVDDEGFSFSADDGEVLDPLFDDRRVWSLATDDFPPDRSAVRRAPWPEPIRRQLDGLAKVELRTHVAGDSLGVADVQFGSGSDRVEIVDSSGRPVALTKWGRLNRTFATSDRAAVDGYLDQVEEVLEVLRADAGRPAFLAFGSLLGAVREGKLIGHDVDVDLGYFSAFDHPAYVILEGFRIDASGGPRATTRSARTADSLRCSCRSSTGRDAISTSSPRSATKDCSSRSTTSR